MPHPLINLNPELKKLFDEGLVVEIQQSYLLVHDIPYLNSIGKVKKGTLINLLDNSGESAMDHQIYFIGEFPCNIDGSILKIESGKARNLGNGICVDFSFSCKIPDGYQNLYEKVTTYIKIISSPAKSLDNSLTEKTRRVIEITDEDSVFKYYDLNSGRAEINDINMKLSNQSIGIIGLGGTGSYVLDLIAKTPVKEIHLFDGDTFLQHNAFRAPGAPSIEKLKERQKKTDYYQALYSNMRRKIISHSYDISDSNKTELSSLNFIFVCIDNDFGKKIIFDFLQTNNIPFIDVGLGVIRVDDMLMGQLRITASSSKKIKDLGQKSLFNDEENDEYHKNIQIADLNALNATMAVIKWKQIFNFYADVPQDKHSVYVINTNKIISSNES